MLCPPLAKSIDRILGASLCRQTHGYQDANAMTKSRPRIDLLLVLSLVKMPWPHGAETCHANSFAQIRALRANNRGHLLLLDDVDCVFSCGQESPVRLTAWTAPKPGSLPGCSISLEPALVAKRQLKQKETCQCIL